MKHKRKRTLLILFITISSLPMMGCGRNYHIKGRIVLLEKSEITEGRIEEITGHPIPTEGKPVAGAKIVMTYELDRQDKPVKSTVWQTEAITDAEGYFDIKDYGPPFKMEKVGLEVSKVGFKTVYSTYIDYSDKVRWSQFDGQ